MNPLSQYIGVPLWDGHIHLFDNDDTLTYIPSIKPVRRVGFIHTKLKFAEQFKGDNLLKLYSDFICNHYNYTDILLADGFDAESIIAIHKKFPDIIKGFGELTCKKNGKKWDWYNESFIKDVCDYDESLPTPLPIYIHWELNIDVDELKKILNKYKQIQFVICHCGMGEEMNDDDMLRCFRTLIDLMKTYSNVWCDISWVVNNYFKNHPDDLKELDKSRVILGSDCTPNEDTKDYDKYYKDLWNMSLVMGNNDTNISRLFKL